MGHRQIAVAAGRLRESSPVFVSARASLMGSVPMTTINTQICLEQTRQMFIVQPCATAGVRQQRIA